MMDLLKGKKAVVTGGTAGIGKEIAKIFVEQGADVVIFGTNAQRAQEAALEIRSACRDSSQEVDFDLVNVASLKEVEEAFQRLFSRWDRLDILVNNAGIVRDNLLMKMSEEDWDQVLDVNLKSLFNTCKSISRQMLKAKSGKIINISSVVGLTGNAGQVNYAASKSGIIGFSKSLAKEFGRKGICVNCIAPGYIETSMTESLPQTVKEELMGKIPMKRLGAPRDIANVALFLASHLSDYMTGQVLTVDGGMVL
jgi:3-oxoacyl-[acyl-carrier protein] reductase